MHHPGSFRRGFKSHLLALAAALSALSGAVTAQDFSFGWNPRSGDVWVDSQLDDVNRYGGRYRDPFVDELVRYHGAPRSLVTELLDRRWAPGDVYMACSIASIIGRPCRYVADEWERDHSQGWGEMAKRMGIKPGSAEFHRLKRGFVPTYDRWGRPIAIDSDLKKDFPGRPVGQAKSVRVDKHGAGQSSDKPAADKTKGKGNAPQVQARGEPARGPVKLDAHGAPSKATSSPSQGKPPAASKEKGGGPGKDKH